MESRMTEFGYETHTDFLFPAPHVLYGIARLIDLGAQLDLYNESLSPAEADYLALYSDWMSIGKDFKSVILEELHSRKDEIFASAR